MDIYIFVLFQPKNKLCTTRTQRHQEAGCFAGEATVVAKYFFLSNTKLFLMEIRQMHIPGPRDPVVSCAAALCKVTWCFTPQHRRVFANPLFFFFNTAPGTTSACVCNALLSTPLCWVMLARPRGAHAWERCCQLGMRGSGPVSLFTRRALSNQAIFHPQSDAFLLRCSQLFHLLHSPPTPPPPAAAGVKKKTANWITA